MVSRKDERGSLYALIAHPRACNSRTAAISLDSGPPLLRKRRDLRAGNALPSKSISASYASLLPLLKSFMPRETALAERKEEFVP
jgi:hypothetical protein